MELFEALSKVIKSQGKDFILSPYLINALIDYNAFETNRALKNIFRNIQSEGYLELLYTHGTWDVDCEQMIHDIELDFAFPRHLVSYVMKSVAYCLGYIETMECEPQTEKEEDTTEVFVSTSGIPTLSLSHLTDIVYIRKDWYDASPVILQDLKVNIEEIKYPAYSFGSQPQSPTVYSFSLSCDLLPKNNMSGAIVLSIIALDKNNKVLFHELLYNKMAEHPHWKRTKIDYYSYDLSINIDNNTFVPFRARGFSFVKGSGDVQIDKFVLCVENGYDIFHYPTTIPSFGQDHKGIYSTGICGAPSSILDLTTMLVLDDNILASSYFQALGTNSDVFLYFEIDNNQEGHNDSTCHYDNYELLVYNKIGNLKQKEALYLNGFCNKSKGNDHHYCISHVFNTLIPVDEISKIIIRKK